MTIHEHLAAAHVYSVKGGLDPAVACARDIPAAAIAAEIARLSQVQQRSHVARVQIAMLRRALEGAR